MSRTVDGAQSIDRAIAMLRLIARHGVTGATASELAKLAELSPSTARRILKCLLENKMAMRTDQGRRYVIGDLVGELALVSPNKARLLNRWRPVIEKVADATRATTYLVMRSDFDTVVLDGADGRAYLRAVPYEIGQRYPLGIGAGSVAILASYEPEQVDEILAANASHYRSYDEGTPERIRGLVNSARSNGYAFTSKARRMPGVCGLAVSVPNPRGPSMLAVSVAAVGEMLQPPVRERLAQQMRRLIGAGK